MKRVFVNVPIGSETRKRFEAISDEYEFVYEEDKDANIIIGNVSPMKLKSFRNLEWIQSTAVGVDRYIRKGVLNEGVILTNAVDIHTKEVAEHTLAMLLSMVKKLYLYRDDQKKHEWADEGKVKEFSSLKVTIVGYGNIGRYLAKLLYSLGIHVNGVKRTMIEKPKEIEKLYLIEDLHEAISDADAVVAILPGNKENEGLFTLNVFKAMKRDAIFINVGRGNLYTKETLKEVLDEKIVAAIASDVYDTEPLSRNSELWDYPNLIVTPHVAGGYHLDSAFEAFIDLAADNLERYISGKELRHIVHERD